MNHEKHEKHEKILYKENVPTPRSGFDVYKEMGCGFLESFCQECLERELHWE